MEVLNQFLLSLRNFFVTSESSHISTLFLFIDICVSPGKDEIIDDCMYELELQRFSRFFHASSTSDIRVANSSTHGWFM